MECSPKPAQGLDIKNYPQQKSYVTIRRDFEKKGSESTAFSVFMRGLRLRRSIARQETHQYGLVWAGVGTGEPTLAQKSAQAGSLLVSVVSIQGVRPILKSQAYPEVTRAKSPIAVRKLGA